MGVFPPMTTTLVIVGIWLLVSIPASLVLGAMFGHAGDAERLTVPSRPVSSRRGF